MARKQAIESTPQMVIQALEAWHHESLLGEHAYAWWNVVTEYRRRNGWPDSPHGRGLALRHVLQEAIEQLQPTGPHSYTAKEWRPYNVLREHYVNQKAVGYIADLMGISTRTYFRERTKALASVSDILRRMEEVEAVPVPATMDVVPRIAHFIGRQAELAFYEGQLSTKHVTVIWGLFGVGKTALAAEIAARRQEHGNVIWLTFRDGINTNTDAMLQEIGLHLAELGHEEYLKALLVEGEARKPQPLNVKINLLISALEQGSYTLCFDNVELILDTPQIASLLEILGDRALQSGSLSLLLIGRTRPGFALGFDFPPLEGLRPEDARQFVDRIGVTPLPENLFEQLHQVTRGNPMLLELFSGWMSQHAVKLDTVEAIQAVEHAIQTIWREPNVADYLFAQVYQTLDAPSRRLAEFASVFREPFDDEDEALVGILADEGITDITTILDGLIRVHLARRVGSNWAVTLHPAIRGYLYSRLKGRQEVMRRLHARVAAYYEAKRRDYAEAAHHWYESGQHNRAAKILLDHVNELLYAGEGRRMLEVLNGLTSDQPDSRLWPSVLLARGDALAFTGESDQAVEVYEEGLALLDRQAPSPQRQEQMATVCHKIGRVFRSGDLHKAMTWYERGLAEAQGKDSMVVAGIYIDGGGLLYQQGRYDESLTWCQRGLDILGDAGPTFWLAQGENFLGHAYYSQGRLDLARHHYLKALDISRQANDAYHIAMSYSNLANARLAEGDWHEALRFYHESVKIKEQIGDIMGLAVTVFNIGSLHSKQGDDKRAFSYFEQCMDIWTRTQSDYGIAATHMNLALVHLNRAEWETADEHLRTSLAIFQRVRGRHYLPEVFRLLAQLRLGQGKLTKAARWAMRSLRYGEELDMRREVAMTCRVLGQIHAARRDWLKARESLERSLGMAQDLTDPYEEGLSHYHLAPLTLAMAEAGAVEPEHAQAEASGHLEQAISIFDRLSAERDRSRAQASLARMLTSNSD